MLPPLFVDGANIRVDSPYGPIIATFAGVYTHLAKEIVEAAQRCSEAEGRWIPIRERLPEGNGDVLAHHEALGPFGNGVVIRPAQVVRHWGSHKDDESMMGAFWMPLPAAPSRSERPDPPHTDVGFVDRNAPDDIEGK